MIQKKILPEDCVKVLDEAKAQEGVAVKPSGDSNNAGDG